MFYVYALIDPRTAEPFYIGKGKNNRIAHHEKEAARGIQSDKCDRIVSIWASGLEVGREIIAYFDDETAAYKFERARISTIGRAHLTNVRPGFVLNASTARRATDRSLCRTLGKLARKTLGFTILPKLRLGGQDHDLPEDFNKKMMNLVAGLIDRRGLGWVNATVNSRGR